MLRLGYDRAPVVVRRDRGIGWFGAKLSLIIGLVVTLVNLPTNGTLAEDHRVLGDVKSSARAEASGRMAHLSQSTGLVTDQEFDLSKVITEIPTPRQCWLISRLVVHL